MLNSLIKIFIIVLLCLFSRASFSQVKNVGLPFVNNYSRKTYNAGAQNWCIAQDQRGIMYYGNNAGLLSFNGAMWSTFPLPNNSIVRSVACANNKVYVGGFNEFGFFQEDRYGNLKYHSLSSKLGDRYKNFDEVWRIYSTNEGLVFQTYYYLFLFVDDEIKILEPKSTFGFSYTVDGAIHIVDREFGLYKLADNKLIPVLLDRQFFAKNDISFIVSYHGNEIMLGTINNGIYFTNDGKLNPWNNATNHLFVKNQIYSGMLLNNNQIAVGTVQNGLYAINKQGDVVLHLNRNKKLQNNTILSVFLDRYGSIWLGLDNGIDMLEVNSALSILDFSYNIESSYAAILHDNMLYLGTNQGLFVKAIKKVDNAELLNGGFEKVDGTLGQVWCLKELYGDLLCGHNFGTFKINGKQSKLISNIPGAWDYAVVPWSKRFVIGGHYTGLNLFERNTSDGSWINHGKIKGIDESCKEISFDDDGNLWVTHALKGLFRLQLSTDLKSVLTSETYLGDEVLPLLPYRICTINDRMYILSDNKLYAYNSRNKRFSLNTSYSLMLDELDEVQHVIQDETGDLWYFGRAAMGVFRMQEDGTFNKIEKPFRRINNNFIKNSFENVYEYAANEYLIGSQDGMFHYSAKRTKNYAIDYTTCFKQIITTAKVNEKAEERTGIVHDLTLGNTEIPYQYNAIMFSFYTPFYEGMNALKHSFRLKGFDATWSSWDNIMAKEYNNLREGDYVFEVKALNIYGVESKMAQYRFTIKPPFYRSQKAYASYVLLVLAFIFFNIYFYKRKIERTRNIEKEKLVSEQLELKQEVIQSEEKIVQLQAEKMKGEMRLKNIELANATMHLIQKNKLLTKVKKDLLNVSDKAKSAAVKVDIAALAKKIDKDINNDKNTKLFDEYFDRVHQDFLKRLKEKHDDLTPKDMRLCAYLKMNLPTKEIAPLMNVSTRGLEISRYRLRKKLGLEREDNLVDYIMNI